MSPASAGALEVERYIGACLISQNRSKNATAANNRDFYTHHNVYHQNPYVNLQGCPEGWAGGVPLISYANNQRRTIRRNDQDEVPSSPLARLAVHTQGAPLILTKSYQHRKNKPQRNIENVQHTKVFENSNNKKQNRCQDSIDSCNKGMDAISVASDESSGSQNSETCLPRIIKPRKRRKKDRKPPHLNRTQNQEGFSTDSASPEINGSPITLSPFLPLIEPFNYRLVSDNNSLFDVLGDLSETPQLHHSFDDVKEVKDLNGNQSTSSCQCRYCDPSGQIWDVDRSCYSPFLTSPKTFQFHNLDLSNLSSPPPSDDYCLARGFSSMSFEDSEGKSSPSFSRSWSSSSSSSFSSANSGDLEVSTEIVTSLNGHRDLEIKFYSPSAKDKEPNKFCVNRNDSTFF